MAIELKNTIYCNGEGTPVVLVHGFPVDHRMWDACAKALERKAVEQGVKHFPIWAPDMPGAGEGPIPSDEDSGGKDADGAFPYGLDRMADAYVDLLHKAGCDKAIWVSSGRARIVRHEGRCGFCADACKARRHRRGMRDDRHA